MNNLSFITVALNLNSGNKSKHYLALENVCSDRSPCQGEQKFYCLRYLTLKRALLVRLGPFLKIAL